LLARAGRIMEPLVRGLARPPQRFPPRRPTTSRPFFDLRKVREALAEPILGSLDRRLGSAAPTSPIFQASLMGRPRTVTWFALRNDGALRFDSFAGRLVETSGDALRRLRHNPNTAETL
jgi:hypothetical protein